MTVPLSKPKVASILRQYFKGVQQTTISGKIGADQSTISLYATRFRHRADKVGIFIAAKEYGMENQIQELRSLAVELHKGGMTTEEARAGLNIIKAFSNLGVPPEQHHDLVKLCKEVNEDGFVSSAIDFLKLSEKLGLSYETLIANYQSTANELKIKRQQLDDLKNKCAATDKQLTSKKSSLVVLDYQLAQSQKETNQKLAAEQTKLQQSLKAIGMQQEQLEEVNRVKKLLEKQGLDLPTFIKMAKEYIK